MSHSELCVNLRNREVASLWQQLLHTIMLLIISNLVLEFMAQYSLSVQSKQQESHVWILGNNEQFVAMLPLSSSGVFWHCDTKRYLAVSSWKWPALQRVRTGC